MHCEYNPVTWLDQLKLVHSFLRLRSSDVGKYLYLHMSHGNDSYTAIKAQVETGIRLLRPSSDGMICSAVERVWVLVSFTKFCNYY